MAYCYLEAFSGSRNSVALTPKGVGTYLSVILSVQNLKLQGASILTQGLAHLVGWGEVRAGNRFSIGFVRIVALLKGNVYKSFIFSLSG